MWQRPGRAANNGITGWQKRVLAVHTYLVGLTWVTPRGRNEKMPDLNSGRRPLPHCHLKFVSLPSRQGVWVEPAEPPASGEAQRVYGEER